MSLRAPKGSHTELLTKASHDGCSSEEFPSFLLSPGSGAAPTALVFCLPKPDNKENGASSETQMLLPQDLI